MACVLKDEIALSYHDSLLRESDVHLIQEPNWINDRVIGFYFEYLEKDVFHQFSNDVCFITPDVTQFIKLYEGPELSIFLEPLNLPNRKLILLAVNNNSSSEDIGGTHWSLLVYVRKDNSFYTLDSCGTMNEVPAKQCALKLTLFLNAHPKPTYSRIANCPQQTNGYDCGMYVLRFAECMCAIHLQDTSADSTLFAITGDNIRSFRLSCSTLTRYLAT